MQNEKRDVLITSYRYNCIDKLYDELMLRQLIFSQSRVLQPMMEWDHTILMNTKERDSYILKITITKNESYN